MSSSSRRRVLRAAETAGEVFLSSGGSRRLPLAEPYARAEEILAAAEARAAELLAAAEAEAARIRSTADAAREQARREGFTAGFAAGEEQARREAEQWLQLLCAAAQEGKAIRDQIAGQALAVVARAVELAVRRLATEWFEADPARTLAVCQEALRAAAGDEVLVVRVHPSVAPLVEAALSEGAPAVQPDDGVSLGGCVIDLRNGRIEATLDARIEALAEALRRASGRAA